MTKAGPSSLHSFPARNFTNLAPLAFTKMQGAGNDFVVIDGRDRIAVELGEFAQAACNRHFGIGADGIIVLLPSTRSEFKMIYHNADGSRAICLNGMRCLARFIYGQGLLAANLKRFELETDTGSVAVELLGRGDQVRVDIGEPTFEGSRIPTAEPGEHRNVSLRVGDELVTMTAVGMGNPHCVVVVDDVARAPVLTLGPRLEQHEFFPKRTNVEFVQIVRPNHLRLRVWERGVGETLACGTGICAAVAALAREKRAEREVTVTCSGGVFEVAWNESNDHIILTGPAAEVYRGNIDAAELVRAWKERRSK